MKVSKPKFLALILALMTTLISLDVTIVILLALIFIYGTEGFEVKD